MNQSLRLWIFLADLNSTCFLGSSNLLIFLLHLVSSNRLSDFLLFSRHLDRVEAICMFLALVFDFTTEFKLSH
ncbi:hypothetical protein FF1_042941 [Malus domestica]